MKKITYIVCAAFALTFALNGCTGLKESHGENVQDKTTLASIVFTSSQVKLGYDFGSYIIEPGDALGVASDALGGAIRLELDSNGSFSSHSPVSVESGERTFYMTYPYIQGAELTQDRLCAAGGAAVGSLPHDQGNGSSWLGYSAFTVPGGVKTFVSADEQSVMLSGQLVNIFSRVQCSFYHSGADIPNIIQISIASASGKILSGAYSISASEAAPVMDEGGYSSVILSGISLPTGSTSASGGLSGVMLLPPGNYDDDLIVSATVKLTNGSNKTYTKTLTGSEVRLVAGGSATFNFDLSTFTNYVASNVGIRSLADWNDFAADVMAGDYSRWVASDGQVHLLADLTTATTAITSTTFTTLSRGDGGYEFDGVFNGEGRYIKLSYATRPIFGVLSGTVKNLVLKGGISNGADAAQTGLAPLASVLDGGRIENVTNEMRVARSSKDTGYKMAGLVVEMRGGTISGCTNNAADITLTHAYESVSADVHIGGFVAIVNPTAPCLITGCINNTPIKFKASWLGKKNGADERYGSNYSGIGGIVGRIEGGTLENHLTIDNCTNAAGVSVETVSFSTNSVQTKLLCVGGIVGMGAKYMQGGKMLEPKNSHYYSVLQHCINTGTIQNEGLSHGSSSNIPLFSVFTGGIAGSLIGQTSTDGYCLVDDCTNTGTVIPSTQDYNRVSLVSVTGGLIGAGGHIVVSNCYVGSKTTPALLGTKERMSRSVGGILGVALSTFNISGCHVNADIKHIGAKSYAENLHMLGVPVTVGSYCYKTDYVDYSGSSISSCCFKGSIECSTTNPTYSQSKEADAALSFSTTAVTSVNYSDYIVNSTTGITLSDNSCWE